MVVITDTFTFIGKAKFSFLIVIKAVATHFVESFCFQDSLKEKKKKKTGSEVLFSFIYAKIGK